MDQNQELCILFRSLVLLVSKYVFQLVVLTHAHNVDNIVGHCVTLKTWEIHHIVIQTQTPMTFGSGLCLDAEVTLEPLVYFAKSVNLQISHDCEILTAF